MLKKLTSTLIALTTLSSALISTSWVSAQAATWACTDTAKGRTVTANTLNVREKPDLKAAIVGKVARNALVCPDPAAPAEGWYTIKSSAGGTGFVLAQWTRPYRAAPPAAAAKNKPAPAAAAVSGFDFGAHFKETEYSAAHAQRGRHGLGQVSGRDARRRAGYRRA